MTRGGKLKLILLVNTAGGVVPGALVSLMRPETTWAGMLEDLKFGLVYSYCIGTMAFAVLDFLAPRLLRLARPYAVALLALSLLVFALAGSFAACLIFRAAAWIPADRFWTEWQYGMRTAIAFTMLIGFSVTMFEGLSARLQEARLEARTRQLDEERARKLATEARLSSLESRIHPHFLFNTLNSISALVREDPAAAERTVERLAALLRYSLDMAARPLVALEDELRIVEDYLDIEKTRFGQRLRFSIAVPLELMALEVPPLALQTLVENSIKYAIAESRRGGEIRIAGRELDGSLVLEVTDDGPGFDLRALKPGHGLENLQERLTALYDGAGRIEIARRGRHTVVSVAVPCKRVAA
jgi:signal transduction histidine kinase